MKKRKLLIILAFLFLLTIQLTGCQLSELPLLEKVSLQIVIDELGSEVEEFQEESIPSGLAKTNGIPPGLAKKTHKKGDKVLVVGGLIHPKKSKYPQLIGTVGEYYELVRNQTNYDIYSIRTKVSFLQVRLVIIGQKDDSTYYAELVEVVDQGNWVYGKLEKEKGRFVLKTKVKGKGKDEENKYIIVVNDFGQNLNRYIKKENYYFIRITKRYGDVAEIKVLDIR